MFKCFIKCKIYRRAIFRKIFKKCGTICPGFCKDKNLWYKCQFLYSNGEKYADNAKVTTFICPKGLLNDVESD